MVWESSTGNKGLKTMKNKIILTAEADFEDNLARQWIEKLFIKIETLNERTKNHTLQIKKLEKEVKELKK